MPSPLDVLKREKLPPPLLFEPRPLEVVARLTPSLGRGGASQGVVFSPDGRHLLQLRKIPPGAILWDVATGKDLRRFESAKEEVRCAAFSPSGHQALLGSSPPRLSIWDVAAGTKVGHLDGHTWAVTAAAWSPDGNRALSGSRDRSVRLWNLAEKKLLHTFEGHEGEVTAVAFSPDGLRAFSASTDKTLRCWDLTARQERLPRGVIQGPVACLGLLPDGKQAVAGGPKGLHSWSLDPLVITNFLVYEGPVSLLAVSGDGQLLAAGNSNGWLGVWNLASGQKLKERRLLPPLSGLSFAADCRHLAASWGMGQVSIFRLP
jgi:WD40 repeat protein